MSQSARDLILAHLPGFPAIHAGRLYTDTSEFMAIDYGDVIAVGGRNYLVHKNESERRFGLEDPKYWVKKCQCLETGERNILKLVFHEQFPMAIGNFTVRCYRSPQKEARILRLVKGDMRFMQGETYPDERGNPVRVLEVVVGRSLDNEVEAVDLPHEAYFHEVFPGMLEKFLGTCEALSFLHENFEQHGDVRRDHIFVEYATGDWRWIDFDYSFEFHENPFGLDLFGLGNILLFLAGQGVHTMQSCGLTGSDLTATDCSALFPNRLVNLRRLFPYVPKKLNDILARFSGGAEVFYDSAAEFIADLADCRDRLPAQHKEHQP